MYTSWIETEFHDTCRTLTATPAVAGEPEPATTERVVVEVGGKRLEVVIPAGLSLASRASRPTQARASARRPARRNNGGSVAVHGNSLTSPMQGTIVKLAVEPGTTVAAGDLIVVLEAMKMEQPLTAHRAGTVTSIHVSAGDSVTAGALICDIND